MVKPSPNQYLLEKEKLIDWYAYNTPVSNDITITPLTGTGFSQGFNIAKAIYTDWFIASFLLLKEFNIWNKAKYYLENKNTEFSSIEFKQAYYYIILRQFRFNSTICKLEEKDAYIRDFFFVYDIIYRELCEDILYILLNLLLADKIIGNKALEISLDNHNKFSDILKIIIEDHYSRNREGYECLKNLRWYTCNNYLSAYDIKTLFLSIQN